MVELNPTNRNHYLSETLGPGVAWPLKQAARGARKPFEGLDERTTHMLEFLLKEEFKSPRSSNRTHLKLASWVIRNKANAQVKRIFDILIALTALILFSPFFLITAIAIKLDTPGPVFYKQTRVGKRGKLFSCYKFRSMIVGADAKKKELMTKNEADEIVFKIRHDPRITRVGRVIRKLSIDELPQLINVLQGNMSIVGPRPPVPGEVENYQYAYYYRLDVTPGITGLQQVKGRSDISFKLWVQLDLEYIQKQSFWEDIKIILMTIPAVIRGKGAY